MRGYKLDHQVFGLGSDRGAFVGREMVEQSGDAFAGGERRKDLSRREGPSGGRELGIDFAIQGDQKLLIDRVESGERSRSLSARAIKFSQSPRGNDEGSGAAESVNDVLGFAAGKVRAFFPPVVEPGEIVRAGFSSHFDRRIEIDQGLVETAVGLVSFG